MVAITTDDEVTPDALAACLERFRARQPHVHCITNNVAQELTANVLLAAGATPSMTIAPEEVEGFVGFADALLVNLGTLDAGRRSAAAAAIRVCRSQGKPWALDPVFVQASKPRLHMARALLDREPALVRANPKEREALFKGEARQVGAVVAVSGATDEIIYRGRQVNVRNGCPLMDRVTAMGCALTALAVGFLAANDEPLTATAAAFATFGLAGERAQVASWGPGTFAAAFLDALAALEPDDLAKGARL